MTEMIDQIHDALGSVVNRGWLNRLRAILDNHPDCLSKPLEIGAMSLRGRRLGEDSDILACVELVADRGMEVSARLPGLDSCFKYCPSVAKFLLEHGFEPNLRDAEGNTCLHYMAEIGCVSIGDIYFEYSCKPGHGLEEGSKLEFSLNWDDFGPVAVDIRRR